MKVKVITSSHSDIQQGSEGEAVENKQLKGYEVTFTGVIDYHTKKKKDITVFMKKSELQFL